MLWSIDRRQKVSAYQFHMTASRVQVYNSSVFKVIRCSVIGFNLSQDQVHDVKTI